MTSGQRERIAFLSSVLLVVLCAVVAVRLWRSPQSQRALETEIPSGYDYLTTQQVRRQIMTNSKLDLPAIASVADIRQSDLPPVVASLIHSEAQVISVRGTRDEKNHTGYLIIYDLGADMTKGFGIVRRSFGGSWKTLYALSTAQFGLVEKQDPTYQAQAEVTLLEQDHVRVVLRISRIK